SLSRVPPTRSISLRSRRWKGRSMAPTSSGSARSERDVKPTRSQNSTVTTLRSSPSGWRGTSASGDPHAPQNRNSPGLSCPQFEHPRMDAVYGQPDRGPGVPNQPSSRCLAKASPGSISGLQPLEERVGDLLRLLQGSQVPGVGYHDAARPRDGPGDLGRQLGWGQLVAVADQHQRRAANGAEPGPRVDPADDRLLLGGGPLGPGLLGHQTHHPPAGRGAVA